MYSFFYDYQMPLFHILLKMGHRGVCVDVPKLEAFQEEIRTSAEEAEIRFYFATEGVNPRSSAQVQELLYGVLHLPKQTNRKTGKATVDKEAIEFLMKKSKHPFLSLLKEYKELEDNVIANIKLDKDGRLRTQYSMTVADTGRLSSRKTWEKTGANLQNIEEKYRVVVVPDEGKVFFGGDLMQAEARLTAYDAEELEMIKVFEEGRNIHKFMASQLFELKEEEVVKDNDSKTPYGKSKRCVHAFDYGLGPKHAAELIGCSQAEAKTFKNRYFKRFPQILAWQDSIRERATNNRVIVSPLERRRVFFGRYNEDLVRKMIAHGPQSSCVDYLNMGLVRMEPLLPEGAELLLQTHDGYVGQCNLEQLAEVQAVAKKSIEVPITNHGRTFVIPLEQTNGPNWKEMV